MVAHVHSPFWPRSPRPICCHRKTIVNSERDVKSLRHCKRRLFYLRQLKREQEIKFEYLSNNYMLADGGTKNLDGAEVDEIRKVIMVKVSV